MKVTICLFSVCLLVICGFSLGSAEVVLDGTMGKGGPLAGPNFAITSDLGKQFGGNLFHSFQSFTLNNSESATFSGPGSVRNIISRVTGGSVSTIDGLLRSTIPGADLYFINPAGVMFGEHAQLDVGGSFHITTADYVSLSDGGRFDAQNPSNSVLTIAPPASFGFLSASPATVSFDGSFIEVPEGKTISVIGGDINMTNSYLFASAGTVRLVSTASAGVLPLDTLETSSFVNLGTITIEHLSDSRLRFDDVYVNNIEVSGTQGGSVYIRGGNLVLDRAYVGGDNSGSAPGGGIDIQVKDDLSVGNNSMIGTGTMGEGMSGDVRIDADSVHITGGSQVYTKTISSGAGGSIKVHARDSVVISGFDSLVSAIGSGSEGPGDAGSISVSALDITLSEMGAISSIGSSTGSAGTIDVAAGRKLSITTDLVLVDSYGYWSGIQSNARRNAGDITIAAGDIVLDNGIIYAGGLPRSRGGSIAVRATGDIVLSGESYISSSSDRDGYSGSILLKGRSLSLSDKSVVMSSALGKGEAGDISIDVDERLALKGGAGSSQIMSASKGGTSGDILINAGSLAIEGGSMIRADTETGSAGNIAVSVKGDTSISGYLELEGGVLHSAIFSTAWESGNAGSITLRTRNLDMADGALISCLTKAGNPGNITIVAEGDISIATTFIPGSSPESLSNKNGILNDSLNGNAGSISIDARSLSLTGDVRISVASTSTDRDSRSGDISIRTGSLTLKDGSQIFADSADGIAGNINIAVEGSTSLSGYMTTGRTIFPTAIMSNARGAGNAGNVTVETRSLEILDGGRILTFAESGNAGSILINAADSVLLSSSEVIVVQNTLGGISSDSRDGNAGNISIDTRYLSMNGAAWLTSSSYGKGDAGKITIDASDSVHISGYGVAFNGEPLLSGIYGFAMGDGAGGDIRITTDALVLDKGNPIVASTGGKGHGGNIIVDAGRIDLLNGGQIVTLSRGEGDAGNITVETEGAVNIGGRMSSPKGVSYLSGISTAAYGSGHGGNIAVHARSINLFDEGVINAKSFGSGGAGSITVTAEDGLSLDSGMVTVSSDQSTGGSISVSGGDVILTHGGSLTASVKFGEGGGGDVIIDSKTFVALEQSSVTAQADQGFGGHIVISSEVVLLSDDSTLNASSNVQGREGKVEVLAPNVDISGSLAVLPSSFVDVDALKPKMCAEKAEANSFVVRTLEGLPQMPGSVTPVF